MSEARERFLVRLRAFESIVTSNDSLELLQETLDPHLEARSRLLRNGLAVSAFSILEAFLKSRVSEVLAHIAETSLDFEDLPRPLQSMCTEGVVSALKVRVERLARDKNDPLPLIRSTARDLASTGEQDFRLSDLGFGHEKSNLNHADVKEALRAFNVQDGWGNASRIAARAGLGPIGLQEAFQKAARRRHRGAHDPSTQLPLGELQSFPGEAIGIAAGFDALVSRSAARIHSGDLDFARQGPPLAEGDIGIRFIELAEGRYRETGEGSTRATKVSATLDEALSAARPRAARANAIVVLRENGITRGWETTDVP